MADSFLNFLDRIDGGGAGQAGSEFQGGGILSSLGNMFFKPRGYYDRQKQLRREQLAQEAMASTFSPRVPQNSVNAPTMPTYNPNAFDGLNIPQVYEDGTTQFSYTPEPPKPQYIPEMPVEGAMPPERIRGDYYPDMSLMDGAIGNIIDPREVQQYSPISLEANSINRDGTAFTNNQQYMSDQQDAAPRLPVSSMPLFGSSESFNTDNMDFNTPEMGLTGFDYFLNEVRLDPNYKQGYEDLDYLKSVYENNHHLSLDEKIAIVNVGSYE